MNLITVFQQHPLFFYIVVTIFGLLIGSFLNVVIYRLPKMMEQEWRNECSLLLEISPPTDANNKFNLILPGSSCPHCHIKISPLDNIPIISFILLRGKCKNCKVKISWRYPLIELSSSLLALFIAIQFGLSIQMILVLLFTWSLLTLSVIDIDHKLLPDNITLPFLWIGIISNIFGYFTDIYSSLFGAIFGYLILWFVYIVFKVITGKDGMGHGDFKLLAMLGAWLGWQYLPLIIILSSLLGSIIGISLIMLKLHNRTQPIPFGPYLALAGWIALIYGDSLNSLYVNWTII
ncbi:MAG: prepilin peptidase [Gammaproteobacteria bacterium]|jgi:leader peptidase (prepilin peptidase)/N-methyltransferase